MSRPQPNIIVSYCLYGDYNLYSLGLFQSLDILHDNNFNVYVSHPDDAPSHLIDKLQKAGCKTIPYRDQSASQGMFERINVYKNLSQFDVIFIRDTDSIILPHEIKFMHQFINSNYKLHVIRSHPDHDMPVMGGLCGYKKEVSHYLNNPLVRLIFNALKTKSRYGLDQTFLMLVYQKFLKEIMVHSTANYANHENIFPDDKSTKERYCGQSLLKPSPAFRNVPKNIITRNLRIKLFFISVLNFFT